MRNINTYDFVVVLILTFVVIFNNGCSPISVNNPDQSKTVQTSEGTVAYIFPSDNDNDNYEFENPVSNSLNARENEIYQIILNAVKNVEPQAALPFEMSPDEIYKLYKLIYTQESEIFWLNNAFPVPTQNTDTVNLFYRYSKENIPNMKAELEVVAGEIIAGIPQNSSKYETALYFHDYIVKNCEFSYDTENCNSAFGALVDGYAQCEGYAFAFSYLCDKANVENIVVTGSKKTDGATHAWNKLRLAADWYNMDCTWDDPVLERNAPDFIRRDYVFVPDSDILNITHIQDNSLFTPPICVDGERNYFKYSESYFDNAGNGIEYITKQMKSARATGVQSVSLRFSDSNSYTETLNRLFEQKELVSITAEVNKGTGRKINSAYRILNDNLYIINLSLVFA